MHSLLKEPVEISVHSYKSVMNDLLELMGFQFSNYFSDAEITNYFNEHFEQKVIIGDAHTDYDEYKQVFNHGVMLVYYSGVLIATVYKTDTDDDPDDIYYTLELEELSKNIFRDITKINQKWYYNSLSRYATSSQSAIYLAYSEYCVSHNIPEDDDIQNFMYGEKT